MNRLGNAPLLLLMTYSNSPIEGCLRPLPGRRLWHTLACCGGVVSLLSFVLIPDSVLACHARRWTVFDTAGILVRLGLPVSQVVLGVVQNLASLCSVRIGAPHVARHNGLIV